MTIVLGEPHIEIHTPADLTIRLEQEGVLHLPDVPGVEAAAYDVLRHINSDLWSNGLPDIWVKWRWTQHYFAHLNWCEPIRRLFELLPDELRSGELCDPQICLQPPDETDSPITSHLDRPPDWANGRGYERIIGIPLTENVRENGAVLYAPFSLGFRGAKKVAMGDGSGFPCLEAKPGDIVVMHPQLPHSGGINRRGDIRHTLYFRLLEVEEAADGL